jgi:hypothetical protein
MLGRSRVCWRLLGGEGVSRSRAGSSELSCVCAALRVRLRLAMSGRAGALLYYLCGGHFLAFALDSVGAFRCSRN